VLRSDLLTVKLDPASLELDTAQFEILAQSKVISDLQRATDLCQGEFLEGLGPVTPEFDRWRMPNARSCDHPVRLAC
jgi:hypothetical protein